MIHNLMPLASGAFFLSPTGQWLFYRSDVMAFLLAEATAIAIAAKPELWLLIIGMGVVLRYAQKQYTAFLATIKDFDDKGERRADSVKELADTCHAHSLMMLERLGQQCAKSDQVTTAALTQNAAMIAECTRVIQEFRK